MPEQKPTGLLHIYTGDGKGKTTAAIGLSIRCAGSGGRVVFCQFLKDNRSSELHILSQLSQIQLVQSRESFGFYKYLNEQQREAARQAYSELLRRAIRCAAAPVQLLVLDEAIAAYNHQLLERQTLLDFLRSGRPAGLEVVLTGREPAPELLELADYVSDIRKIKHPFDRGIAARRGVEK